MLLLSIALVIVVLIIVTHLRGSGIEITRTDRKSPEETITEPLVEDMKPEGATEVSVEGGMKEDKGKELWEGEYTNNFLGLSFTYPVSWLLSEDTAGILNSVRLVAPRGDFNIKVHELPSYVEVVSLKLPNDIEFILALQGSRLEGSVDSQRLVAEWFKENKELGNVLGDLTDIEETTLGENPVVYFTLYIERLGVEHAITFYIKDLGVNNIILITEAPKEFYKMDLESYLAEWLKGFEY